MLAHLLNSSLTIYRGTFTADGRGGRTKAMASVGTVRAKVGQPTAMERSVAAQLGATIDSVVHVPYVADVRRGDELDAGGTRRLRVVSVVNDSHRTYKRLDCQVIQGG